MMRLYDNHLSGNGYKPRLLLAHLVRSYERVEIRHPAGARAARRSSSP